MWLNTVAKKTKLDRSSLMGTYQLHDLGLSRKNSVINISKVFLVESHFEELQDREMRLYLVNFHMLLAIILSRGSDNVIWH
jgi:hypothetical protein